MSAALLRTGTRNGRTLNSLTFQLLTLAFGGSVVHCGYTPLTARAPIGCAGQSPEGEARRQRGAAPWWNSSLGSFHLYGLNCHSCPVVMTHTTRSLCEAAAVSF